MASCLTISHSVASWSLNTDLKIEWSSDSMPRIQSLPSADRLVSY